MCYALPYLLPLMTPHHPLQEVAVLDLVATAVDRRGEGHCRAMLQALEGWLGPELHVAQLVAVCPADVSCVWDVNCL